MASSEFFASQAVYVKVLAAAPPMKDGSAGEQPTLELRDRVRTQNCICMPATLEAMHAASGTVTEPVKLHCQQQHNTLQ